MIKNITTKLIILVLAILVVIGGVLWFVYESPKEMLAKIRAGDYYNRLYTQALYETGLKKEEHYLCMAWAFGEDYLSMQKRNVPDVWNQRHGDIFIVHGADDTFRTFKRIGEAYKKRRLK